MPRQRERARRERRRCLRSPWSRPSTWRWRGPCRRTRRRRARRGRRRQRRRVPRHRRPAAALRTRARHRHAARGAADQRACVGMAAQGLRPVGEIQFMGFLYPCIDQLVNHASRLRNRTQGRLSCPMVLRTPCGAGIRAPEHHSESTEAMLAHIPGLRVVIAVLARARLRPAAGGHPRPRPGGVPGADAPLSLGQGRGRGQRRGPAARRRFHPEGGQGRDADRLGRRREGAARRRRGARRRRHRAQR